VRSLSEEIGEPQLSLNHLAELEAIATEAKHLRSEYPGSQATLEQLIVRSLWQLLYDPHPAVEAEISIA